MKQTVAVVGGAGHVGLGICLLLANRGYRVYGIDIDSVANEKIMRGEMPFIEEDGEAYLARALQAKALTMTCSGDKVKSADIVLVVIGTPVDDNLNPDVSGLTALVGQYYSCFRPGQLVVLRSTVSPGTTQLIKQLIEAKGEFQVGKSLFLVYAPERVAQGKSLSELQVLPQLVGAFDDESYRRAESFFGSFVKDKCFRMTPVEAEIAKLITNMTRYVEFALANEYYIIAETFGANIHRIRDACNYNYPRLNLPTPGPNVGGPCLYKDGWFLLERFPFADLISTAFKINEGMTMQIAIRMKQYLKGNKVAILGMTYKAGSDDTRNSLSFKLKKQLLRDGYELVLVDPHLPQCAPIDKIAGCSGVVLMTPHREFHDLGRILDIVGNDECVYVDIWGFWDTMKYKANGGYFTGREARVENPRRG